MNASHGIGSIAPIQLLHQIQKDCWDVIAQIKTLPRFPAYSPFSSATGSVEEVEKLLSKSKRKAGFALLELLVVIGFISLLASIAVMHFSKFRVKAYDSTAKSDLQNAMSALEVYFVDSDTYPATSSELLANDLNLSQDVSFTDYQIETITAGSQTVYMVVKHASSPNSWQASYPEDGNNIELEGKPLEKRGKRLGHFK